MTTNAEPRTSLDRLMYRLVLQAETDFKNDRRSEPRFPFFRAVSVRVDGQSFSAFTREISASAIGLLHNMELPQKEVEILVSGQRQVLPARIERCESCGEGWYISGCMILNRGT
jgi:PilZ domain-containing protein